MSQGFDDIIEELLPIFIEDTYEKINTMRSSLPGLLSHSTMKSAVQEYMRQIHSLKGTAPSFGFNFIGIICHKLEDYFVNTPVYSRKEISDISAYLREIEQILERRRDPSDTECATIFRRLPDYFDPQTIAIGVNPISGLFIGPRDVQFLIIEKQLKNCGIRPTNITTSLGGIEVALRTRPDFIMASNIIDNISGFEVISALKAFKATKGIPSMLIISESDYNKFKTNQSLAMPKGVMVIRKGAKFSDDFADALTTLNII